MAGASPGFALSTTCDAVLAGDVNPGPFEARNIGQTGSYDLSPRWYGKTGGDDSAVKRIGLGGEGRIGIFVGGEPGRAIVIEDVNNRGHGADRRLGWGRDAAWA